MPVARIATWHAIGLSGCLNSSIDFILKSTFMLNIRVTNKSSIRLVESGHLLAYLFVVVHNYVYCVCVRHYQARQGLAPFNRVRSANILETIWPRKKNDRAHWNPNMIIAITLWPCVRMRRSLCNLSSSVTFMYNTMLKKWRMPYVTDVEWHVRWIYIRI